MKSPGACCCLARRCWRLASFGSKSLVHFLQRFLRKPFAYVKDTVVIILCTFYLCRSCPRGKRRILRQCSINPCLLPTPSIHRILPIRDQTTHPLWRPTMTAVHLLPRNRPCSRTLHRSKVRNHAMPSSGSTACESTREVAVFALGHQTNTKGSHLPVFVQELTSLPRHPTTTLSRPFLFQTMAMWREVVWQMQHKTPTRWCLPGIHPVTRVIEAVGATPP